MKMEQNMPPPGGNNSGEAQVFSSKAGMMVKKLTDRLAKENVDAMGALTEESAREFLSAMRMMPGVTIDDVVAEMKKTGVIKPPAPAKKAVLPPPPPEKIETKFVKLGGIHEVQDEGVRKALQETMEKEHQYNIAVAFKSVLRQLEAQEIDIKKLSEVEVSSLVSDTRITAPGVTYDDIMSEIKKAGLFAPPVAVKKDKKAAIPLPQIHVKTEFQKLQGLSEVRDEHVLKMLQETTEKEKQVKAMREEAAERRREEDARSAQALEANVFKNQKGLNSIYESALNIGPENSIEKVEYYYEFSDAGLIPGGKEKVQADLEELAIREAGFKIKNRAFPPEQQKSIEQNKKIATIVEYGIAYGATKLNWYSKNAKIRPAGKFNDVMRGVDDMFEISKNDAEDLYLGLGMDITYNGLMSERYRDKVERLLESIRLGKKTKIKYFKNQKGEMKEEFAVPKIILHFDGEDVKEIAEFVKNAEDESARESFRGSPMKFKVLNQVMIQCELLATFARECGNSIASQYQDIVDSINELGNKNPEIGKMLEDRKDDQTTLRLRVIIDTFKKVEMAQAA